MTMRADESRLRFAAARIARLATVSAEGVPHLVPVVFALRLDAVYLSVDAKPKTTRHLRRLANIASTGRVSLLVDHYSEDWAQLWWVRVDGLAEVLADGSEESVMAIDALVEKYEQYSRARPGGPAVAVRDLRWRGWSADTPPERSPRLSNPNRPGCR